MADMRRHITNDTFVEFVQQFMFKYFKERHNKKAVPRQSSDAGHYPEWIVNALHSVDVSLP